MAGEKVPIEENAEMAIATEDKVAAGEKVADIRKKLMSTVSFRSLEAAIKLDARGNPASHEVHRRHQCEGASRI